MFFVKAISGGALVTLLSFLLQAVNSAGSRIALTYMVGALLAIGPFDYVIVTSLHVLFGIFFDANVGLHDLLRCLLIVTAGNLAGGLGLVTLTHIAQAKDWSRPRLLFVDIPVVELGPRAILQGDSAPARLAKAGGHHHPWAKLALIGLILAWVILCPIFLWAPTDIE